MLDEEQTPDSSTTAGDRPEAAAEEGAVRPRRRRAAKRPAGPPVEAQFSGGAQSADNPETPAPEAPKRRRRAATTVDFEPPTRDETPPVAVPDEAPPATVPLFQPPPEVPALPAGSAPADGSDEAPEDAEAAPKRSRRRRRKAAPAGEDAATGKQDGDSEAATSDEAAGAEPDADATADSDQGDDAPSVRRRRRRRRGGGGGGSDDSTAKDEVTALKGSTRIEAKRQRRKEGRESGRRRAPVVSEAEFLARRESVDRVMVVRQKGSLTQIVVLEDGVLVEHYVNQATAASLVGNVYLGKVQNVLPSMEAAFVDIGRGRNAVLYAGEVNWDAAGLEGQPKRIEQALSSGDKVLVQVTKDPVGHKGARLTSQVSLPGRFIVYVPDGSMTGISRKLPEKERTRLRGILRKALPEGAGVIVRTAAEGASEEDLLRDVNHLTALWDQIKEKAEKAKPPAVLHSEPDLALRVVRDIFNSDFKQLVVEGDEIGTTLTEYVADNAPTLSERVTRWTGDEDVFAHYRVDEQLAKALDRKVYLPSGGSLVIDRTEAMTVVDVNTGRFTGQGGNLEETVTRNNLEAAEEIVRQIRLRDVGGIIVIDFIDMVLESNRDLVVRRLVECLGRDRTKHQVAEVSSLGLVQMTRKRIGQGLLETFSEPCDCCNGRGVKVHSEPVSGKGGKERKPRSVRPPGAHDPVEAAARARSSEAEEPADEEPQSEAGSPAEQSTGAPGADPASDDLAHTEPESAATDAVDGEGGLTDAEGTP